MTQDRIHATTVVIDGAGVLITGASGTGKSDLALRLIDRGALLVADDQTCLEVSKGTLVATAVKGFAGKMEVRGLGIINRPYAHSAVVALHIAIDESPKRSPDSCEAIFLGIATRSICVNPRQPSAPIIVELALT